MGIPGFNVWFSEKYANSYTELGKVKVDHLYIDLNSVLHTVMRTARTHGHFHKKLFCRLNDILDVIQPAKSVMIAVDGPAPLAKLLLQRDRRKKIGRAVEEGETLTSVAITPGTTFMLDLTHSLTYYCCQRLSSRRYRNVVFEISDGTVKGEGEVKILGRLARPWFPEDPNDSHVIVGDDADLILMALTSYKENLYVVNANLNSGRLDRRLKVLSVNLLHEIWASSFLSGIIPSGLVTSKSALFHAKLDLTLIAIMSKGNDYLPGLKGAVLEKAGSGRGLWGLYQRCAKSTGGWISSTGFITSLDPRTGHPRLDAAALAKLLVLNGAKGDGDKEAREWRGSKAAADPRRYLRGCVWLLQMYYTGQCPDYRFVYDGVAPTADAVRATCDALIAEGHPYVTLETFGPADPRATEPLLPITCALAMLPSNCHHLAVPCVRPLMQEPADGNDDDGDVAGRQAQRFSEALYYDLYGKCVECNELGAEFNRIQLTYTAAKKAHTIAVNRAEAARNGTAPVDEPPLDVLLAEAQEAECTAQTLKEELLRAEAKRKDHISLIHPYRPFPVEKLERAIDAVLATGPIRPAERRAAQFGRSTVLRSFASKPEAAVFIRSQILAQSQSAERQWQQQLPARQYVTQGAGAQDHQRLGEIRPRSEDYRAIFTPPQPPFPPKESVTRFATIVRQEVLNDEHGSSEPVRLDVVPGTDGGVVPYLSQEMVAVGMEVDGMDVAMAEVVTQTAAAAAVAVAVAVMPSGGESNKRSRSATLPEPPAQEQALGDDTFSTAAAAAAVAVAAATAAVEPSGHISQRYRAEKLPGAPGARGGAGNPFEGASGSNGLRPSGSTTDLSKQARRKRSKAAAAAAAVATNDSSGIVASDIGAPGAPAAAAAGAPAASSGAFGTATATVASLGPAMPGTAIAQPGSRPPPMPSISLLTIACGGSGGGGGGGGGAKGCLRDEGALNTSTASPMETVQGFSTQPSTVGHTGYMQPEGAAYDTFTHPSKWNAPSGNLPPPPRPLHAPYGGEHQHVGPSRLYHQYGTGVHPFTVQRPTWPPAFPMASPIAYGGSGYGRPVAPYRPLLVPPAPHRSISPTSAAAAAAGRLRVGGGSRGPPRP